MRIHIDIKVNKAIQIMLTYLFFIVMAESLFTPIFAVFITKFITGATLRTAGFALALLALVKSVVQVPLARYLDKHKGEKDDFYALMVGAVLAVIYPFGLIFISEIWHLYFLQMLAGVGTAALMAAYYSLFARHVDKGSEGFEWSLFSVGGLTVSGAIGAAVGGVLADMFGFQILFLINSVVNFIVLFFLLGLYPFLDGARPVSLPPFSPIPKNPTTKQ